MISVIMTCYNSKPYILNAVESIIKQTYVEWELIIIDDAGTDGSGTIAINKCETNKTKCWRLSNNVGHTCALNKALQLADGEYIAWHDSDDISMSKRFEKQIEALEANPLLGFVTTHGIAINEDGNRIKDFYCDVAQRNKKTTITDKLKDDCWLLLPSMMFRKSVIDKIGAFDETCYYAQDLNFVYRMLMAKYDFTIIDEELFKFRKHKKSIRASNKYKNKNWHKYAIERAKKCPIIKCC